MTAPKQLHISLFFFLTLQIGKKGGSPCLLGVCKYQLLCVCALCLCLEIARGPVNKEKHGQVPLKGKGCFRRPKQS
ncbi:MAG: hypothetical protein BYD32DRAFT_418741 [Podila humilis]|nr:MAG: hypothetical protein BYD32DRAFT_418741 [Podila humilis]